MKTLLTLSLIAVVGAPCLAQDSARPPGPETRPGVRTPEGRLIDLRPKWERGQQVRYTLEMRNSTVNDAAKKPPTTRPGSRPPSRTSPQEDEQPADDGNSRSVVQLGLLMKVKEVSPEKVATVDMTIERMKITSTSAAGEIEFDSSKPSKGGDDDIIAQALGGIVGTTMTLTVDREGTITNVAGGEGLMMLGGIGGLSGGGLPGGPPGTGAEKGTSQLFGPIFSGRPAKGEARVGESWEYDDGLSSGLLGGFKMTTRHTLTGTRGNDAMVTIRGKIEPSSESPGDTAFQLKDSSYQGSYRWDTAKGQLAEMETTMSVRLDGKVGEQQLQTRNESAVKITRGR